MPARKVSKNPRAVSDLEAISDYFDSEAGIDVAVRFLEAAEDAFQRLLDFPELGASRQWLNPRLPGLRMWPISDFPHYLVFYLPHDVGVQVVRVLHSSQDIPTVFEDE